MHKMFQIHRVRDEVFVSGFIPFHPPWAAKKEMLDPGQAGVMNALLDHGFDRYTGGCYREDGTVVDWNYPARKGVFDSSVVRCVSSAAADEAERILTERIQPGCDDA